MIRASSSGIRGIHDNSKNGGLSYLTRSEHSLNETVYRRDSQAAPVANWNNQYHEKYQRTQPKAVETKIKARPQ